jgi:aspartate aminotransferase-like enzyme
MFYHTTMPTNALKILRNVMKETQSLGFAALKDKQIELGTKVRNLLVSAVGVPLQCDERPDFRTFRIGLFGLEKLAHIDRTVGHLEAALEKITETEAQPA